MADDYRLVFDLATTADRWFGAVGPMFILPAVGLVLVITPQRIVDRILTQGPRGVAGKIFGVVFFLFTGSIAAIATYSHFNQVKAYVSEEKAGQLSFVDGCLQGFHPMPKSGHEYEIVEVGGEVFSYSDFDESSPAFNNSESHGGPIHSDSAVRIWHSGNHIIRLEVRDHACPPAPYLPRSS